MEDLKKNAEGYSDPTAYKAIRNVEGDTVMEIYRGDIYFVKETYRKEEGVEEGYRPAIVVSNNTGNHFSELCSIVWLTTAEKKPLPTHCEILARVPSTALCEQVTTINQKRLYEYVRTATEEEMKEIDKCLMCALGVNGTDTEELEDLRKKDEFHNIRGRRQSERIAEMEKQLESLPSWEEVYGLKAQVEMLEKQNERLLDRLID